MQRISLLLLIISFMTGCNTVYTYNSELLQLELQTKHPENENTLMRIAFLGDAEPKPLAEFPHMANVVKQINEMNQILPIDFVIGVGDIAHKGTEIQYDAATPVLQGLEIPFYPIMGNEEWNSTEERFLHYAGQWNDEITAKSFVLNHEKLAFLLASPDKGRDFKNRGAKWVELQLQNLAPKPVFLVVHGAQQGVYPERADKGIGNSYFIQNVIAQPNLKAVISGDLHMDMERVEHSKKIGNVQYLHIPALERTKIPDEDNHVAMVRIMTILKNGNVQVETYAYGEKEPRAHLTYSFKLDLN